MISCKQLRTYVIQPVLHHMGIHTPWFEELLVSTSAQETKGGTYIHQINGPAIGLYEMQIPTCLSTWNSFKLFIGQIETLKIQTPNNDFAAIGKRMSEAKNSELLCSAVKYYLHGDSYQLIIPDWTRMAGDLYFATVMAALNYYLRSKEFKELKSSDIKSLWNVYKPFWNTEEGKATFEEFERNYQEFIKT